MQLPTVSVVIPTYERSHLLAEVLAPLLEDPATTEIVVVVDGGHDNSAERLESISTLDARLRPVIFEENKGRSVARQAGVEAATSEVILLLDDDVVAQPGLVTGHATRHASRAGNYELLVLGYMPTVVSVPRRRGDFATFLYATEYENACVRYDNDPSTVLTSLWGGNFSISRATCLRVGLMSEGFENRYHQDADFGVRCAGAGVAGVFDRTLSATHRHARSMKQFLADSERQGAGAALLRTRHGESARKTKYAPSFLGTSVVAKPATTLFPLLARLGPAMETNAARVLRRIYQQRGARSVRRQLKAR